ncbi:MAG TPA: HIT domain-containing protein [Candidatus Saccharimonadales bacterium]|nr:HIT domain-containing protein [Candidatus Saccharimonadales bacterium]
MAKLTPEERKKQEFYRTARTTGAYDKVWQTVGYCAFCKLNESYVFHEENGIVMTVALYAYVDGHFMVIPRRHVRSVKDLTPAEWETMRKFFYIAKKLIREVHGVKGMQIVQKDGVEAQSTVEHLHFHCIPFDSPDLSKWNYRDLKNTPIENAELYHSQDKKINQLSKRFKKKYTQTQAAVPDKKKVYREAFMKMLASKKESQAKKTAKVGAAIIAGGKIIAMSNASLIDGPMEVETDGIWVSPPAVSHAEERCIAQAAKDGLPLDGATMIVNLSPCMKCCRLIASSGIKELHYIDDWWDKNALDFLAGQGVRVVKVPYKKPKKVK